MKTYGFNHYGNGIRLNKTLFDGFPSAYVTKEVSDNGWTRIVGSVKDAYKNDFKTRAEAVKWVKDKLAVTA